MTAKRIFLVLCFISHFSHLAFAQFTGGSYDGLAIISTTCPAVPAIFAGGSYDGYSINSISCPATIFSGGSYDGFALAGIACSSPFLGGSFDGFAFNGISCPVPLNIFPGGSYDGFACTSVSCPVPLNIFLGGSNSGFAISGTPCPPVAAIFAGGSFDGFALNNTFCPATIFSGGSYDGFSSGNISCPSPFTGGSYDGFAFSNLSCPLPANVYTGGAYDGFSFAAALCRILYYSRISGNWSNAATWSSSCGGTAGTNFPEANDEAIICSGNIVTVNVDPVSCYKLTVNGTVLGVANTLHTGTGGIIINPAGIFTAPSSNTNISGNFFNSGTFNHNNGTLTFNGSTAQTISGNNTFYNLTINNSSGGVAVTSGSQNLVNTLTLSNGLFATNDDFTLISGSGSAAQIAQITSGGISGNITMQRYLGPGPTSWRMLSAPVGGATLAAWYDDFYMQGFPGVTGGSFVSVYTYDETVAGNPNMGLVAPTNVTNPLTQGKGYLCYVGPVPLTIDVTGPPNTGNVTLPLTYTNTGSVPDDGWNLAGNPYPSAIDWDAAGWTKTNVLPTVYIWNAAQQNYASYLTGGPNPGPNGGIPEIASSQAFWVKTNGASPELKFTESVKTTEQPPFLKTETPYPDTLLKLKISGNGYSDETFIRFKQTAADTFIGNEDSYKFFSPNTNVPQISSVINDSLDLSFNSVPQLTETSSIPVRVKAPNGSSCAIITEAINIADSSGCFALEDLLTGITVELNAASYSFSVSDTDGFPRFILHKNISAVFSVSQDTVYLSNGGTVSFYCPLPTAAFQWDFGDGSTSLAFNPVHSYTAPGTHTVSLTVQKGSCSDSFSRAVTVLSSPTLINDDSRESEYLQMKSAESAMLIFFNFNKQTQLTISTYNLLGQKMIPDNIYSVTKGMINAPVDDLPSGMYFVGASAGNLHMADKLIIWMGEK